jgi:hypothetical protein
VLTDVVSNIDYLSPHILRREGVHDPMSICVKQVSEDAAPALDLVSACVQARCIRNEFCLLGKRGRKPWPCQGELGGK